MALLTDAVTISAGSIPVERVYVGDELMWSAVPPMDYPTTVLADSPVLYWRFEEGSGTTVADATGNGHDGSINGDMAWVPGTMGGTAIQPDTVGYASVPAFPEIAGSLISFEFWVCPDVAEDGWAVPFVKCEANAWSDGFGSYYNGLGLIYLWFGNYASTALSTPYVPGVWTHLVATNGATASRLYKDGSLVTEAAAQPVTDLGAPLCVGAHEVYGLPSYMTKGSADEVAVYDYELTAEQVAAHYAAVKWTNKRSG